MGTHRKSTFLGEVAASLYARHRERFASLALLFPSRRARLFFAEELAAQAQEPIWEPEWLSLDRLTEELSGLRMGDRLRLVVELYRVYCRYHQEEFDRFYFWGEMLLSDFDMIDKYRVDAEALFSNISDLKDLESDLSYLTEEQRALISRFWEGVLNDSADSEERRRFLSLWATLWPLYRDYRAHLLQLGFGYGGLLQRVAAGRLEAGLVTLDPKKQYVVAGFNALTTCEKVLFDHLRALGAEFFWDYDESYLCDEYQEAGMFMRENCRRYPEVKNEITHRNYNNNKKIEVVSTPSDAVQCKVVSDLLDRFRRVSEGGPSKPLDRRTAVILTNEDLLMPLLYSLDSSEALEEPESINVTMGFPLKQTSAYTFVERLLNLQAHQRQGGNSSLFYYADVTGLLAHPYLDSVPKSVIEEIQHDIVENRRITIEAESLQRHPLLTAIFCPTSSWESLSNYLNEVLEAVGAWASETENYQERVAYLTMLCDEITKLRNSLKLCEIDISISTFTSVLRRHLQTVRIPFEGEPLNGVQIMGILETRNLDFERVILLSMTDDNFPGPLDNHVSYIPYHLRAAYGLPTPEHHEGVHAYYFYRLLQRADEVVLCYCAQSDSKSTGEPSRYIRQLEYEERAQLGFSEVGLDVNLPEEEPFIVEKEGVVRTHLERFLATENPMKISPTALFRYVVCPLKFYFYSIAKIKERDEVSEEVDNPIFGTLLHASMEELYASLLDRELQAADFDCLAEGDRVEQTVRRVIERELFQRVETPDDAYPGGVLLVRDIVVRYIREGILPYDRNNPAFQILGTELSVEADFAMDATRRVRFAGLADRLDRMSDGRIRIVDYKTGSVHLKFKGLEDLFLSKNRGKNGNIFQTLLYALMWWHTHHEDAYPALYYVRQMNEPEYSPYPVDLVAPEESVTYRHFGEMFEEFLREKLCELFDFSRPFAPCDASEQEMHCRYCDYRAICRRL